MKYFNTHLSNIIPSSECFYFYLNLSKYAWKTTRDVMLIMKVVSFLKKNLHSHFFHYDITTTKTLHHYTLKTNHDYTQWIFLNSYTKLVSFHTVNKKYILNFQIKLYETIHFKEFLSFYYTKQNFCILHTFKNIKLN